MTLFEIAVLVLLGLILVMQIVIFGKQLQRPADLVAEPLLERSTMILDGIERIERR